MVCCVGSPFKSGLGVYLLRDSKNLPLIHDGSTFLSKILYEKILCMRGELQFVPSTHTTPLHYFFFQFRYYYTENCHKKTICSLNLSFLLYSKKKTFFFCYMLPILINCYPNKQIFSHTKYTHCLCNIKINVSF